MPVTLTDSPAESPARCTVTRTPGPAQQIRTVPSVTDCQAETRLAAAAAFQLEVGLRLRLQPGPPVESLRLAATGNGRRDTRRLRHPSLGVMPVMILGCRRPG